MAARRIALVLVLVVPVLAACGNGEGPIASRVSNFSPTRTPSFSFSPPTLTPPTLPTGAPSSSPTEPTETVSPEAPTSPPTPSPSKSASPSKQPTESPSASPSASPSPSPSPSPSASPSPTPTQTAAPTTVTPTASASPAPASSSSSTWWWWVLAALVLAAAVIGAILWRRRARSREVVSTAYAATAALRDRLAGHVSAVLAEPASLQPLVDEADRTLRAAQVGNIGTNEKIAVDRAQIAVGHVQDALASRTEDSESALLRALASLDAALGPLQAASSGHAPPPDPADPTGGFVR